MDYEFKNNISEFVEASKTKAIPVKELTKEPFTPTNQDNQDIIVMLDNIAAIRIQLLIDELQEKNLKQPTSTYQYLGPN